MLAIQQRLTPYNFTAMSGKENTYIVIHYVGAVSTAKNNADYYANNRLSASAHYFVDETEIWQSVLDSNRAWHCGGGLQGNGGHSFYKKCTNSNSIGIEMCCKKTNAGVWYFEPETIKNATDLVRYLMNNYNIPIERVIRHYDVTGKICPEPYVRDEKEWEAFKKMAVNEEEPMTTEERKKFNGLVEAVAALTERMDSLQNSISELGSIVQGLTDKSVYQRVSDIPEWGKSAILRLIQNGSLKGDYAGNLNLSEEMLRLLVIFWRETSFKK